MKQLLLFVALFCAATLSSSSVPPVMSAAEAGTKERATVKFDRPVMLLGVALQGTYLFVHDEEAMSRGDACTYVYKGVAESRDKLVISFHCVPKERSKATHFTVRSIENPEGQDELTEYQFSGSSEGHVVPVVPMVVR